MMSNMKTKEPTTYQLVSPYGTLPEIYSTWAEADHEATSIYWMKGITYKIVEVVPS
jgi:hypothetical protein